MNGLRVGCLLVVTFGGILFGCAANGAFRHRDATCWISEQDAAEYPPLIPSSKPGPDAFYVAEGVYRARFELSRMTLGYSGAMVEIGAWDGLDYCILVAPECSRELERRAKPPRWLRDKWWALGRVRALVSYTSDAPDLGCGADTITIVKLISVERAK